MRISINLATRPYADQGPMVKRLRIGMAVLAGLLLILGLGLLHFHQSALRIAAQEQALDESIANIQKEQQGYQVQMQQPANARVLNQARFLNHLFDEKSFSWTAAMENLELVLPGGVQVTAIEPVRAKDGQLTLRLRVAGQRERAVQMVRNMEHSQRFLHPRITGENSENTANGNGVQAVQDSGRVSFEVLAEYNPATLAERKAEIASHHAGHAEAAQPQEPAPRPAYVAPNPQPGFRPMGRPIPNRFPNGPNAQMNQGEPTGFDPNGLKNHSRNRLRPDGSEQDPTAAGGPQ